MGRLIEIATLLIACTALVGVVMLGMRGDSPQTNAEPRSTSLSQARSKIGKALKAKFDTMSASDQENFMIRLREKVQQEHATNLANAAAWHSQQLSPPIQTSTWAHVLMDEQQRACLTGDDVVDAETVRSIENMLYSFDSIVEGVYTNDFDLNLNVSQVLDYLLAPLSQITTPGFLTTSYANPNCEAGVYNLPVGQLSFGPAGFLRWAWLIKYFDTGDNAANLHQCYRWYNRDLRIVAMSEKIPAFGPSGLEPTAFTYIGVHNYYWIVVPTGVNAVPQVAFWNEYGNDYMDFSSNQVTDAYGIPGTGQGCWGRDILFPNGAIDPARPWREGSYRSSDLYTPTRHNLPLALPPSLPPTP